MDVAKGAHKNLRLGSDGPRFEAVTDLLQPSVKRLNPVRSHAPVSLVASYIAARRAITVDPAKVLCAE